MRVLLDTNIVLDFLLARPPFATEAHAIWQAHEEGRCVAHVAAITPVNVHCVARKLVGRTDAQRLLNLLLGTFPVCPIDRAVLTAAQQLGLSDYEDAVQLASAQAAGLDAVVTRDGVDYRGSTLTILTPPELLARV